MTIHHDKLAYGKLATLSEELSEEKLLQMLKELDDGKENEQDEKENNKSAKKLPR